MWALLFSLIGIWLLFYLPYLLFKLIVERCIVHKRKQETLKRKGLPLKKKLQYSDSAELEKARAYYYSLVADYKKLSRFTEWRSISLYCDIAKELNSSEIITVKKACANFRENIPKWKEYSEFETVFSEHLEDYDGSRVDIYQTYGSCRHSYFNIGGRGELLLISLDERLNVANFFKAVLDLVTRVEVACIIYKPDETTT